MVTKALFVKYAASQNYFYSKEVGDILRKLRNKQAIRFKDLKCYDEEEEYLRRVYTHVESLEKLKNSGDYYRVYIVKINII
jgi:hypothetical protein